MPRQPRAELVARHTRAIRIASSLGYIALLAAFFAGYYLEVRRAPPGSIVDYNAVLIVLVLPTLLVGVLVGRWWTIALPLAAFPITLLMIVVAAVDDRYSEVAADRGGAVGPDWFGVAALVCMFGIPAAAFGAGLRALGAVLESKWRGA